MITRHLMKLRARDAISADEEQHIRKLVSRVVTVPPDRTFIHAAQELTESTLLLDGWMARAKILPSGHRQLAELHVAGDFTDLHGFTLKHLDHDIVSITKCTVAMVPHDRLRAMTERSPHVTRLYWLMTNMDAAIQREWTLSLGSRSAISRMANLFCELLVRLEVVGLVSDNSYSFPLTQVELGECLGLTAVHVNRTLQELRRTKAIEVRDQRVQIFDLAHLQGLAEFDPSYLYLDKRDR
jgi:CRP-like cAMP-binding protein